jgi:GT2 family glycosyltransferase
MVSVIVVNYRTYDDLAGCLQSLAEQGDERVEVIVVDQACEGSALQDLSARFPWVRFEPSSRNHGFAAGINRGTALAQGEYLLLINPDCRIGPRLYETLAGWLDTNSEFGVVGPLIRNEDGTIQQSARRFPDITTAIGGRTSLLSRIMPGNWFTRRNLLVGSHPAEPITVDWVSGACMMVRRNAFKVVGGMDESFFMYWEDADLCCRLGKAGWRTAYHPGASVVHSGARASVHSAERSLVAFHLSAYQYVRKHGSRQSRILAPLVLAGLEARLALKLAWRRARHVEP